MAEGDSEDVNGNNYDYIEDIDRDVNLLDSKSTEM